jgi:hypothetical protein
LREIFGLIPDTWNPTSRRLLSRIEQATYKAAVEQQRANLAKAKATEVNAALQLERGKELVGKQNIPQATVDQRAADEAAAQANVLAAKAMLDQAEINLGYTEIRSPINGRIGLANFTVGNLIDPSSGKLATIVSQDPIYVIFQASERIPIIAKESEDSSALPAFARRCQGVLDPLNDSSELAKLIKAATGDWDCELILTDEPFVGLRAMDESWANRFFGRKAEVRELVE